MVFMILSQWYHNVMNISVEPVQYCLSLSCLSRRCHGKNLQKVVDGSERLVAWEWHGSWEKFIVCVDFSKGMKEWTSSLANHVKQHGWPKNLDGEYGMSAKYWQQYTYMQWLMWENDSLYGFVNATSFVDFNFTIIKFVLAKSV